MLELVDLDSDVFHWGMREPGAKSLIVRLAPVIASDGGKRR
jgi:hypothetical protein